MKTQTINPVYSVYRHSQNIPNHPALVVKEKTYSYSELVCRAQYIAAWLQSHSAKRVGILASGSLETYLGVLSAHWMGAGYVPLNPTFPTERIKSLIKSSDIDALIIDEDSLKLLDDDLLAVAPKEILSPSLEQSINTIQGKEQLSDLTPLQQPVAMGENDLAYLMFTSGSTGEPKGVPIYTKNLSHFIGEMQKNYRLTQQDRLLAHSYLSFDLSIFDIFVTWHAGATLYAVPKQQRHCPYHFIRQHEISIFFTVPTMIVIMHKMKMLKPDCFPSLRLSLFAGESLSIVNAELWSKASPNSRIDNLYGPTETVVSCISHTYCQNKTDQAIQGNVAIGRAIPGTFAAIIDKNNKFLSPGESGQLVISGAQLSGQYWHNEVATKEKYIRINHPEHGLITVYLTGDRCKQDEHGLFHYMGRFDNQYKIYGFRIELEEIEFYLRKTSGSEQVAAVVVKEKNGIAQHIHAFISNASLSTDNLKKQLQELLPHYMVPSRVHCLDSIPYNSNGKIDRHALKELV